MLPDGLNTNSDTNVNSNNRTTTKILTTKDQISRLKSIQDKLFAIIGLQAAIDKLKALKYEVVVHPESGCTQISVDLKVDYDFNTGLIGGKDVMVVINEP